MADDYVILDPRFERLINPDGQGRAAGDRRALDGGTGLFPGRRLCSSGPTSPTTACSATTSTDGHISIFRRPCDDRQRQHHRPAGPAHHLRARARRSVSRTEHDGRITTIADHWQRQAAEQPKRRGREVRRVDLVHRPELRHRRRLSRPPCRAARSRPATSFASTRPAARSMVVADDFVRPNGLAFSPDEIQALHCRQRPDRWPLNTRRISGSSMSVATIACPADSVFAECTAGVFDGFRVDEAGNLFVSSAEGIHCYRAGRRR